MRNKDMTLLLGIAFTAFVSVTTFAQSKPQGAMKLQGVWRVTEVTFTGPNARTVKNPQPGLVILTAKHFSFVLDTAETGARPALPGGDAAKATADQLRATWGPFNAISGTYEVRGGEMTMRNIVTKASGATGTFNVFSIKQEGNTVTTVTIRTDAGPVANPATYKWTRME